MSNAPRFANTEEARRDGETVGHFICAVAAATMIHTGSEPEQVRIAGFEFAEMIVARSRQLAEIEGNLTFLHAWREAAAEAFTEELEDHTALLLAATPVKPVH